MWFLESQSFNWKELDCLPKEAAETQNTPMGKYTHI